jgi:hypothetical protein
MHYAYNNKAMKDRKGVSSVHDIMYVFEPNKIDHYFFSNLVDTGMKEITPDDAWPVATTCVGRKGQRSTRQQGQR